MHGNEYDSGRQLTQAERYVPEILQEFLVKLERSASSEDVWRLIVAAGRQVGLPCVDLAFASDLNDRRPTVFVRMSYDASWLQELYQDDELAKWSYFRHHGVRWLTPVLVGWEFIDEYHPVPRARQRVLREAAQRGLRAGFAVPLRQYAPPQSGLITFAGDHSRREMRAIAAAHGWALHAIAMAGYQRYLFHFAQEFGERNKLSPKQVEILKLIGRGSRDKEIADSLAISVSAVRQRLEALRRRTGLETRAELAALAMALGLLADPLLPQDLQHRQTLVRMDGVGSHRRPAPNGAEEDSGEA
ncbi:helix-turn-helix transcriptional regulator [Roseivivax sp. CAU 1761]